MERARVLQRRLESRIHELAPPPSPPPPLSSFGGVAAVLAAAARAGSGGVAEELLVPPGRGDVSARFSPPRCDAVMP